MALGIPDKNPRPTPDSQKKENFHPRSDLEKVPQGQLSTSTIVRKILASSPSRGELKLLCIQEVNKVLKRIVESAESTKSFTSLQVMPSDRFKIQEVRLIHFRHDSELV